MTEPGLPDSEAARPPPGRHPVSISTKLAAGVLVLVSSLCFVLYLGVSRYEERRILAAKVQSAESVSQLFVISVSAAVDFDSDDAVKDAIKALTKSNVIRYVGVWRVQDKKIERLMYEHSAAGVTRSATAPTHKSMLTEADGIVGRIPILAEDQEVAGSPAVLGHAVIDFSLAAENQQLGEMRRNARWTSLGVSLTIGLMLMLMAQRMVIRPIFSLRREVSDFERSRSIDDSKVPGDELGELALGFRELCSTVLSREEEVARAVDRMQLVLDNVGQGFLVLDAAGKIAPGISQATVDWFGTPEDGDAIWKYMARIDSEAGTWLEFGWEEIVADCLPLEVSVGQLPKRAKRGQQVFELAYRPLTDSAGKLEQLIVVVSDITLLLETERQERAQRELTSALHKLTRDRAGFRDFLEDTEVTLATIAQANGRDGSLLALSLHSLKGTCGLLGVESVSLVAHELEERMTNANGQLSPDDIFELESSWKAFRERFAQYMPGGDVDALAVTRHEYDTLQLAIASRTSHEELLKQTTMWSWDSVQDPFSRLGEHARELAAHLGKEPVDVLVHYDDIRTPPGAWGDFWHVIIHAVRNAVDHGLETREQRLTAGKDETAIVELSLTRVGDHVVMCLRDNGRGVDWDRVRELASKRNLRARTRKNLIDALFSEGFSTARAVTTVSGRGVGMAALKRCVDHMGGALEIESEPGKATQIVARFSATRLIGPQPTSQFPLSPPHKEAI